MTRKDYELIAGAIRDTLSLNDDHGVAANAIYEVALRLKHRLRSTNPRFEVARFMTACGFPSDF